MYHKKLKYTFVLLMSVVRSHLITLYHSLFLQQVWLAIAGTLLVASLVTWFVYVISREHKQFQPISFTSCVFHVSCTFFQQGKRL